jgi:hypothetical protein
MRVGVSVELLLFGAATAAALEPERGSDPHLIGGGPHSARLLEKIMCVTSCAATRA